MNYKHSHAIAARIEYLGKLNDRRLAANEAGDLDELENIARAYELLQRPCWTMAREIRIAIAVRRVNMPNLINTDPPKLGRVPELR